MDFLGKVQQLEFATLVAHGGEGAHQFTDAAAIDVSDVAQVQQHFLVAFGKQISNGVTQNDATFAERDSTAQVYHRDAIYLPGTCFHCHCLSSEVSAAFPWTCLIKVI